MDIDESLKAREEVLRGYELACLEAFESGRAHIGGAGSGQHARKYRATIVKEFLKSMPTKQCHNCHAPAMRLRKDG